jgi:hypothetical protein
MGRMSERWVAGTRQRSDSKLQAHTWPAPPKRLAPGEPRRACKELMR